MQAVLDEGEDEPETEESEDEPDLGPSESEDDLSSIRAGSDRGRKACSAVAVCIHSHCKGEIRSHCKGSFRRESIDLLVRKGHSQSFSLTSSKETLAWDCHPHSCIFCSMSGVV